MRSHGRAVAGEAGSHRPRQRRIELRRHAEATDEGDALRVEELRLGIFAADRQRPDDGEHTLAQEALGALVRT